MKSREMFSLTVGLFSLAYCWTVVKGTVCQVPVGAVEWDSNPSKKIVDVVWGYNNWTCHTQSKCNGSDEIRLNATTLTEAQVEVQLHPVEIQEGNNLRFRPTEISDVYVGPVYKVDEEGFRTCNASQGTLVEGSNTSQPFVVPHALLGVGLNYFIVDSSNLILCYFGLRLNVTVKSTHCQGTMGAICNSRGTCVTYRSKPSFSCHCCGNYKGDNCDIYDACLSNPCGQNGVCLHKGNSTLEYQCDCTLGYYGTNCQNQVSNLCDVIECQNNSTCLGNSTSFECDCPPGLTGTHCEVDINECQSNPCQHGHCVDKRDGYTCVCQPGYHGVDCSERHHECSLSPCRNGGYCQSIAANDSYRFVCHCPPGWEGKDCTTKVSPCHPNPCSRHGTCVPGYRSFSCKCARGFTGSLCEVNINECQPNPCRYGGHCRDHDNGYTCLCVHLHAGSNCQYTVDLFSPVLNGLDARGHLLPDSEHTQNLYIVAGTLSSAVVVMIIILIVCYCRVSESYRDCMGIKRIVYRKYSSDNLTVSVDVTSSSDCPLTSDSFFRQRGDNSFDEPNAYYNQVV